MSKGSKYFNVKMVHEMEGGHVAKQDHMQTVDRPEIIWQIHSSFPASVDSSYM